MDGSLCPRKCRWWKVLFLWSLCGEPWRAVWACPANCLCNRTEIACTNLDDGSLFPLLEGQDAGPANGSAGANITDLSRNIRAM